MTLNNSDAVGFKFTNPQLWTVIQQSEKADKAQKNITQVAIRQIVRKQ